MVTQRCGSGSGNGGESAKTHQNDVVLVSFIDSCPISHSSQGLFLSQRKYVLDLLTRTDLLGTRPSDTPMDSSVKLDGDTGNLFLDIGRYHRLVGKLIYLIVTCPDITYVVGVVSQFMHAARQFHFVAMCRILQYLNRSGFALSPSFSLSVIGFSDVDWAGNKTNRRSTSGYCTFVGGNLVTWRSKKQTVAAHSSVEAEYRAMTHTTSEMLWIQSLLQDFSFSVPTPMTISYDNQAQIRPQGEFESLHRDLIYAFGTWEFEPMDLENPFPNNEGSIQLWHGDEDRVLPVTLQRYIVQRLPWIEYHELQGSGHMFPYADGMTDAMIKALLVGGKCQPQI
ncbi:unnamed protein product [Camellia sinensis]